MKIKLTIILSIFLSLIGLSKLANAFELHEGTSKTTERSDSENIELGLRE